MNEPTESKAEKFTTILNSLSEEDKEKIEQEAKEAGSYLFLLHYSQNKILIDAFSIAGII